MKRRTLYFMNILVGVWSNKKPLQREIIRDQLIKTVYKENRFLKWIWFFNNRLVSHMILMFQIDIYGKCMTQTKSMSPTTIHTGKVWWMSQSIKTTYIKTYIYLIVEQCFSTINKSCTYGILTKFLSFGVPITL